MNPNITTNTTIEKHPYHADPVKDLSMHWGHTLRKLKSGTEINETIPRLLDLFWPEKART